MSEAIVSYELVIDCDDDFTVNGRAYLQVLFTGEPEKVCAAIVEYLGNIEVDSSRNTICAEDMRSRAQEMRAHLLTHGLPEHDECFGGNHYIEVNRASYDEVFRV